MKQYINQSQLNELSEKGKEKLRKWVLNNVTVDMSGLRNYIMPTKEEAKKYYDQQVEILLLLSIGQMIEFLTYEKPHGHLLVCTELKESAKHGWRVVIAGKTEKDTFVIKEIHELCDCLWQAVKEVLEG